MPAVGLQRVPINVFAYLAVIRRFVGEMKLIEAENVLFDMEESGIAPNADCYQALIQGCCETKDCSKSLALSF